MNDPGHVHNWTPTDKGRPRKPNLKGWVCPSCKKRTFTYRPDGPAYGNFPWGFTNREGEVIRLLAEGRSIPYITTQVGLNASAVTSYLARMRGKMGTKSRGVGDYSDICEAWESYVDGRLAA